MERMSCVVLEDNILEFLNEVETQMSKGIICCKCEKPCDKNTRCAVAMKNLLTDIELFKKAYSERNISEEVKQEKQVLED